MERIAQEEANRLIEEGKEEIRKILDEGGKVTDTIIKEKDRVTTIRKIERVNGESTISKIVQTKNGIKNTPVVPATDVTVKLDGKKVVKTLGEYRNS